MPLGASQAHDQMQRGWADNLSALRLAQAAEMFCSKGSIPTNDELVLFCALWLRHQQQDAQGMASVHLLTDDTNLRVRAHAEQLGALGFDEAPCTAQQVLLMSLQGLACGIAPASVTMCNRCSPNS